MMRKMVMLINLQQMSTKFSECYFSDCSPAVAYLETGENVENILKRSYKLWIE
jgi:hypothetical protein